MNGKSHPNSALSKLQQRMLDDLELAAMSPRTQEAMHLSTQGQEHAIETITQLMRIQFSS